MLEHITAKIGLAVIIISIVLAAMISGTSELHLLFIAGAFVGLGLFLVLIGVITQGFIRLERAILGNVEKNAIIPGSDEHEPR